MRKPGLLERLKKGPVLCAEGYVFELERRGYVQAGAFVPEVVLDHPEAVLELHREFLRAGSDVVEALTYYAHRDKLRIIGREDDLESINREALKLARKVAGEGNALLAGNICNTNIYIPDDAASEKSARHMFEEQVQWATDAGVDFFIGETFAFLGEALLALDVIKKAGATAVVTLAIHKKDRTRDGSSPAEACKRLRDEGADVVGLNCIRGPGTMLPLMEEIRKAVEGPIAALPVPYRTTKAEPTFQSLSDPRGPRTPHGRPFPTALDPLTCTRYEIAEFTKQARDIGVNYIGLCCGAGPHHIRAMAE
ncbi:MAG: homocysteine S-methyltransferase family protein, partial [Acidobacteria bacterium]|nr:homocysteine S-methyltransferase family protein [Acidobacteriota bacterium]